MSTKELFGDSSSDEDDDVADNANPPQAAPPVSERATSPRLSTPTHTTDAHNALDDSDNDEGDVEFDDRGTVVGLSSTTIAGDQINTPTRNTTDPDQAGTQARDNDEDAPTDAGPRIAASQLYLQQEPKISENIALHMTKLPNLVGIQTQAFDPDTYHPAMEEDDFGQSVYNLVRWRYRKDDTGNYVRDEQDRLLRESNSRLVQWEDGSYTLHIGNEAFEIDALKTAANGFPGLNGFIYRTQKAVLKTADDNERAAGTVLECVGAVATRMTIRPSSLQSEAHKSLTVGIRQKTMKKARIAEYVTQEDPEKAKQDRIKVKQDLEKVSARKRSGYSQAGGRTARPRMSRSYLEEEEDGDYDTFNIKDTKRRIRDADEELKDYGDDDDSSSEDDEYDQTFSKRSNMRGASTAAATAQPKKESDEEIVVDDEEEDDDEDMDSPLVKAKKISHKAVLDDSDSE